MAGRLGDEALQAEILLLLAAIEARKGADTLAGGWRARDEAARIGSAQLETWAYLTGQPCAGGSGQL